jgi:hypothetical protein
MPLFPVIRDKHVRMCVCARAYTVDDDSTTLRFTFSADSPILLHVRRRSRA